MAKINFNLEGSLSEALQELINQYNATPEYTARTSDQIRAQAEAEYGSHYNDLRTAARIAQERDDLALAQQAAALDTTYNKVREASAKDYRRAYSQADRQMLSRGMQRSSYGAQTLANIAQEGVEAQRDIWDQQAAAENNIAAQRAQREGQLADLLRQYDINYASDVLKRTFELENQDYERQMQNTEYLNNLAAQIYGYLQNNLQWNGSSGGGYGGGYSTSTKKKSSSGSSSSSTATTQTTTTPINNFLDLANTALAKTKNTATALNTALQNAAAGTSANTPTTKVIQGPVNQNVLAAANNAAAKYGVNTVFTNPLVDALNKKATTTNTAKTTTTANANKKITAIKTSNALR